MKKHFALLIFIASTVFTANAQSGKSIKIGYIDMEYILENVPEYNEANIQLEKKAQTWKAEMETKKSEISKLKESLKTEQVLLTKELIQERQDEITYLENELMEYQQKRFGPAGELVTQKAVLVKPIQDQIFSAVQDLAEAKKYDFIFDKSSDLTMLFAAKRYDISDFVIRVLSRASRQKQMSKKQIKEEEAKEYKENVEDANPELAARQKMLDDRKAAREKLLEERKAAFEAKVQAAAENRKKLQEERNNPKPAPATPVNTNTNPAAPQSNAAPAENNNAAKKAPLTTESTAKPATATTPEKAADKPTVTDNEAAKASAAEAEKKAHEAQQKSLEDRRKALEEKKAKILAEREAARKAKEEEQKNKTKN